MMTLYNSTTDILMQVLYVQAETTDAERLAELFDILLRQNDKLLLRFCVTLFSCVHQNRRKPE